MISAALVIISSYVCDINDTPCWRGAALEQEERAERAELKLKLQIDARKIVEGMAADSETRAKLWRDTAEKIAPKPLAFYESPFFWVFVGAAVGSAATVAVVYAVVPARNN